MKAFPDTEEPLTPTTISKPTFIAGQRRLSFPDMDDVPDDVPDGFSCTEETLVLTPESSSIVTANADDINHEDDISVDDMPERWAPFPELPVFHPVWSLDINLLTRSLATDSSVTSGYLQKLSDRKRGYREKSDLCESEDRRKRKCLPKARMRKRKKPDL